MNQERPPSRFARLMRPRPAPTAPDPADVGTAFGLDLSMATLEIAPPAPTPQSRGARWVRRLVRRADPAV